jgi:hypothetical protein
LPRIDAGDADHNNVILVVGVDPRLFVRHFPSLAVTALAPSELLAARLSRGNPHSEFGGEIPSLCAAHRERIIRSSSFISLPIGGEHSRA